MPRMLIKMSNKHQSIINSSLVQKVSAFLYLFPLLYSLVIKFSILSFNFFSNFDVSNFFIFCYFWLQFLILNFKLTLNYLFWCFALLLIKKEIFRLCICNEKSKRSTEFFAQKNIALLEAIENIIYAKVYECKKNAFWNESVQNLKIEFWRIKNIKSSFQFHSLTAQ